MMDECLFLPVGILCPAWVACPGSSFWAVCRWAGVKGSVRLDGFPCSHGEESQVHSSHPAFPSSSPETQALQEDSWSRNILLSLRFFCSCFDSGKKPPRFCYFASRERGKREISCDHWAEMELQLGLSKAGLFSALHEGRW